MGRPIRQETLAGSGAHKLVSAVEADEQRQRCCSPYRRMTAAQQQLLTRGIATLSRLSEPS